MYNTFMRIEEEGWRLMGPRKFLKLIRSTTLLPKVMKTVSNYLRKEFVLSVKLPTVALPALL